MTGICEAGKCLYNGERKLFQVKSTTLSSEKLASEELSSEDTLDCSSFCDFFQHFLQILAACWSQQGSLLGLKYVAPVAQIIMSHIFCKVSPLFYSISVFIYSGNGF